MHVPGIRRVAVRPLLVTVLFGFSAARSAVAAAPLGGDVDGDGWTVADGDCCDDPAGPCGPDAAWVNPGAFDAVGNALDDDCDGAIDDPPASDCSTAPKLTGLTGIDLARAIDLCQETTANPPLPQRRWGVLEAGLLRASGTDVDSDLVNFQAAVLASFGAPGNAPRRNATMAALATKTARDPSMPGYQEPVAAPSWNDVRVPPLRYDLPGCPSPSLDAVNSVRLRLVLRTPTNATGFRFRDTFFSAEFPDVCFQFNDHLIALLHGTAPGIPADLNVQFDSMANLVTVNSVFYDVCTPSPPHTCPLGPQRLAGTGFDAGVGGATVWLDVSGPVVGGETIVLEIHLFNLVDGQGNAVALVDDFEWILRPSARIFDDGFESGDTTAWSSTVP
jgi:hypothetical protein